MKDTPTLDLLEEPKALSIIRTETALSRFPMHRLSKTKEIEIELTNEQGAVYWSVSHNAKFGQPGPLAYKLDTLLINRRIEEAQKPLPRIIRLGSMPEIAREMGFTTRNWNTVRQALYQNASAFITAKITYKDTNGQQRWLEAAFTRYQVIMTGESLPEQGLADGVYIVLSDVYRELLNSAIYRPLDYEYMKSLPPSAQRFYEIVSYQIFAAVKNANPRARLLYSDYCGSAPAPRYFTFDQVKKQMHKVHRYHLQSGYIAKVSYESTVNDAGEADWWMYYTPGPNAGKEFQAFTGTTRVPRRRKKESPAATTASLPFEVDVASVPAPVAPGEEHDPEAESAESLVQALVACELNRSDAERFARERPEVCRRQLEYLPFVREFKSSRGAYLRRAIEGDFGAPAAYAQQQAQQEAAVTAKRDRAQARDEESQEKARQSHQERFCGAYRAYLRVRVGEAEKTDPEALTSFEEAEVEARARLTSGPFAGRPITQKALEVFDQEASRLERAREFWRAKGVETLSFWEWDEALNEAPFGFS